MSEPLLNVMKIMLIAGLYLFFVRVLWSVYNELRDPRAAASRRAEAVPAPPRSPSPAPRSARATHAQPQPRPGPPPPATASPAFGERRSIDTLEPMVGQLVILAPDNLAGASYALGHELTIGRAEHNGIRLPDSYVSSVHARVFLRGDAFYVEDLDSRNGSRINGDPLVATTRLERGDQLAIGGTVMEFS